MTKLTAGEVVGVFRKCIWCQKFRTLSCFVEHAKVCRDCFLKRWSLPAGVLRARAIVLTDSGRTVVAGLRASEVGTA